MQAAGGRNGHGGREKSEGAVPGSSCTAKYRHVSGEIYIFCRITVDFSHVGML